MNLEAIFIAAESCLFFERYSAVGAAHQSLPAFLHYIHLPFFHLLKLSLTFLVFYYILSMSFALVASKHFYALPFISVGLLEKGDLYFQVFCRHKRSECI